MWSRINPLVALSPIQWARRIVERMTGGRLGLGIAALAGAACGLLLLAVQVSNARSYLSDAPEACINCHVMTSAYAAWDHSSHRGTATCNDCHVPHDRLVRKLAFKMMDGGRHTFAFTLHLEPQTLRINEGAEPVVQRNCVRCHEQQVMITKMSSSWQAAQQCWDCHRETPHGRTLSLSSAPHVRRPTLPSAGMPRPDRPPAGVPGPSREEEP
jgi:cytochrome c nitrite reductase small subunit